MPWYGRQFVVRLLVATIPIAARLFNFPSVRLCLSARPSSQRLSAPSNSAIWRPDSRSNLTTSTTVLQPRFMAPEVMQTGDCLILRGETTMMPHQPITFKRRRWRQFHWQRGRKSSNTLVDLSGGIWVLALSSSSFCYHSCKCVSRL